MPDKSNDDGKNKLEGNQPGESDKERVDRELIELLNELRVALPGIQVLFAFLLTVPFSQRFGQVTPTQRTTFFFAFSMTAISSILLIAPTLIHRLEFRAGDKEQILQVSNRLTIVGTLFLAAAITSVVFLISDVLYNGALPVIATVVIGALIAAVWYALPLLRQASGAD
jgi:predicted neutral ceramidase superfamily lipid hydrolase